jgi:L-threonylcarbamoyladenylate synthase
LAGNGVPETLVTREVATAAAIIRRGGLVAFPTETVYGLGANALDDAAVAAVFAAKGRPQFNPLITHVDSAAAARKLAEFPPAATRLADAFWPGPLTLVLERKADCPVSLLASAGLSSMALRVPAHPLALALIAAAGVPLVAPSANRSGAISPTTPEHVLASLGGRIDAVLDGGQATVGVESTVISCLDGEPALLRPGGLERARIEALLGIPLRSAATKPGAPLSPGQLDSHYAPRAPLRLGATSAGPGEALLAFGPDVPAHAGPMENLSASGDVAEAAAHLFAALHRLDALHPVAIAVMTIPEEGLGEAIHDRLRRAAAPRPHVMD